MVKPVSDSSEYTRGDQQALDDFGITQLLSGIRSYSDEDFEADRARMTARDRKLCGVSDSARRGESQRKYDRPLPQHSQKSKFSDDRPIAPRSNSTQTREGKHLKSQRGAIAILAIVRILPNAERYTIARFVNRQDAEDRRRALCRFIRGGVFEVVCDRA